MNIVKTENDIELFLSKEVILSPQYSNYAIAVYCVLKALNASNLITKHCLTPQQIGFYLTDSANQSRRFTNYIKCGLDELVESGVITKEGELQKGYILDCSRLRGDTKDVPFVKILFSEVRRIFKDEKTNNFILLKYFIFLVGTFNGNITTYIDNGKSKSGVIGNLTIAQISELSGISVRSVIEYNKLLEELKLIYIRRQEDFLLDKDTGEVRTLPNVYGRFENMDYVDAFTTRQQKFKKSYKRIEKNKVEVNNNRSLAQKYQQILKGNDKKYSKVDIQNIYDYVISENKKYENTARKHDNEDIYLENVRDVDVFDKYDFLKRKKG